MCCFHAIERWAFLALSSPGTHVATRWVKELGYDLRWHYLQVASFTKMRFRNDAFLPKRPACLCTTVPRVSPSTREYADLQGDNSVTIICSCALDTNDVSSLESLRFHSPLNTRARIKAFLFLHFGPAFSNLSVFDETLTFNWYFPSHPSWCNVILYPRTISI